MTKFKTLNKSQQNSGSLTIMYVCMYVCMFIHNGYVLNNGFYLF